MCGATIFRAREGVAREETFTCEEGKMWLILWWTLALMSTAISLMGVRHRYLDTYVGTCRVSLQ